LTVLPKIHIKLYLMSD